MKKKATLRKEDKKMDIKKMAKMMERVNEVITSGKEYYDDVKFAGGIVPVEGELAKAWKILLVTVGEIKGVEHLKMRLHQDGIVSLRKQGHKKYTVEQILKEGLKVGIERMDNAIKETNKIMGKGGVI